MQYLILCNRNELCSNSKLTMSWLIVFRNDKWIMPSYFPRRLLASLLRVIFCNFQWWFAVFSLMTKKSNFLLSLESVKIFLVANMCPWQQAFVLVPSFVARPCYLPFLQVSMWLFSKQELAGLYKYDEYGQDNNLCCFMTLFRVAWWINDCVLTLVCNLIPLTLLLKASKKSVIFRTSTEAR